MRDIEQLIYEHGQKLAKVNTELDRAETEKRELKETPEEQIKQLREELEQNMLERLSYRTDIHLILSQNVEDIKALKLCKSKLEELEEKIEWMRKK